MKLHHYGKWTEIRSRHRMGIIPFAGPRFWLRLEGYVHGHISLQEAKILYPYCEGYILIYQHHGYSTENAL